MLLDRFELGHNFDWQVTSVVADGFSQALLELLLKENVKLSLEFVLFGDRELLATSDLLFKFFDSKSENGFLETVTDLSVLVALSKIVKEALAAALCDHLLLLGAQEGSLTLTGVIGVFIVRSPVLLLNLLGVLLANLGNDVLDRGLVRGDGIFSARVFLGLFELR